MNPDGTGLKNLTDHPGSDEQPGWSPDDSKIVFQSHRDGNWEIYIMSTDGSNQRRLTDSLGDDVEPAWSPDGTKIAFTSNRSGNQEICTMNTDGSGLPAPTIPNPTFPLALKSLVLRAGCSGWGWPHDPDQSCARAA